VADYKKSPEQQAIDDWERKEQAVTVNVLSMIQEAITLHRLLLEDEAKLYADDGTQLADDEACRAAGEREIKAFRILARMTCMTPEEAQVKLAYFMETPIPGWFSNLERLTWEAYINEVHKGNGDSDQDQIFLRTLFVKGGLPLPNAD
jgi:hypothetical protein